MKMRRTSEIVFMLNVIKAALPLGSMAIQSKEKRYTVKLKTQMIVPCEKTAANVYRFY